MCYTVDFPYLVHQRMYMTFFKLEPEVLSFTLTSLTYVDIQGQSCFVNTYKDVPQMLQVIC